MAKPKTMNLTSEQRDVVRNMLEASLTKLDSGYYEYRDDYSDELVAKRAGVTTYAVGKIRSVAFGKLKPNLSDNPKYGAIVDMVKKQGERIAALEARINAMTAPRLAMSSEARNVPINNGTMR